MSEIDTDKLIEVLKKSNGYQILIDALKDVISRKEVMDEKEYQQAFDNIRGAIDDHVETYIARAKYLEAQAIEAIRAADYQVQERVAQGVDNTLRSISYQKGLDLMTHAANSPYLYQETENRSFRNLCILGLVTLTVLVFNGEKLRRTFFPTLQDMYKDCRLYYDDTEMTRDRVIPHLKPGMKTLSECEAEGKAI